MFIKIETIIGFDPVEDYERHHQFVENNDLSQWKKSETTQYIMYTKTDMQHITEVKS